MLASPVSNPAYPSPSAALKVLSFANSGPSGAAPKYTGSRTMYHTASRTAEGCSNVDNKREWIDGTKSLGGLTAYGPASMLYEMVSIHRDRVIYIRTYEATVKAWGKLKPVVQTFQT